MVNGKKNYSYLTFGRFILPGLGAAAFAGVVLAATAAKADHPAGTGGKITVHMNRGLGGFDALKVPRGGLGRSQVLAAVHETLLRANPKTGKMDPQLATGVTSSDDFKKWRVKLRDGIKFANGEPMTSEAYVHHFNRLLGSKLAVRYRTALGTQIARVVAIDRLTIEFQMSEPQPAFRAVLAMNQYPWLVNAPGFAKKHENDPNYNGMVMGAGPYMLKEWIPKERVILVRNPHYYNPNKQHLDQITYRVITGPESGAYLSFLSGDLDAFNSVGQTISKAHRDSKKRGFTVVEGYRETSHYTFNINSSKPPLNDLRVRRALAHAVDRVGATKVISRGSGRAANQDHPPESPWHCKGIKSPKYNPAKAKALLKDFGKPVAFKLLVINHANMKKTSVILQEQFAKVGVKVELEIVPRSAIGMEKRIFEGSTESWVAAGRPLLHPLMLDMNMHSKAKGNVFRTKSPKLDAAIEKVKSASLKSAEALKAAHCEFVQAQADEVPIINILYTQGAYYAHKHIKGIPFPISGVKFFHEAYIEK